MPNFKIRNFCLDTAYKPRCDKERKEKCAPGRGTHMRSVRFRRVGTAATDVYGNLPPARVSSSPFAVLNLGKNGQT